MLMKTTLIVTPTLINWRDRRLLTVANYKMLGCRWETGRLLCGFCQPGSGSGLLWRQSAWFIIALENWNITSLVPLPQVKDSTSYHKQQNNGIIEKHLPDSQMGFRKGRGTRDATFQFWTIAERPIQVNKKCMHALWHQILVPLENVRFPATVD